MLHIKHKQPGGKSSLLTEPSYDFGLGDRVLFKVGVLPLEARIIAKNGVYTLYNMGRSSHVLADGEPVQAEKILRHGMTLSIGADDFELIDSDQTNVSQLSQTDNTNHTGWSLIALNTPLVDKAFKLKANQSLGRADYCDICLKVVHLSRRHAQINVEDGHLQVTDLSSSNGTFLNGKRISSAYVISGDELAFDTLKFKVLGPKVGALADKTALRVDPAFDADKTVARPFKSRLMAAAKHAKKTAAMQSAAHDAGETHPEKSDTKNEVVQAKVPAAKKTKIMQQAYQAEQVYASKPAQSSQESGGITQYILAAVAVTVLVSIGAAVYIIL